MNCFLGFFFSYACTLLYVQCKLGLGNSQWAYSVTQFPQEYKGKIDCTLGVVSEHL